MEDCAAGIRALISGGQKSRLFVALLGARRLAWLVLKMVFSSAKSLKKPDVIINR